MSESAESLTGSGRPSRAESSILLRQARGGSNEALGTLFELCGDKLLALIRVRLGPTVRREVESQDILQQTLLKAFRKIEQFEGSSRDNLMGWLATIAWNEIRDQADFYQRLRRDVRLRQTWVSGFDPAARQLHTEASRIALNEESRLLVAAMDRLTVSHREVIVLRRFEELSFREIGQRLDRTPEAARKLFARSMSALTVEMQTAAGRSIVNDE
jgi:RNA polymerase sigma-70 factor (ECF subfamily)